MSRRLTVLLAALAASVVVAAPAAAANSWPAATPPSGLVGTGYGIGDIAPDVVAKDQYGDLVSLHQFHGRAVMLHICGAWCGPCQQLARDTPAILDAAEAIHGADAVQIVEVLSEGTAPGVPATQAISTTWADRLSLNRVPVLHPDGSTASPVFSMIADYSPDPTQQAIPLVVFLDRNMEIVSKQVGYAGEAQILQGIADAVAHAVSPEQALAALEDELAAADLSAGVSRALHRRLEATGDHLAAGDDDAALRALRTFIRQVEAMTPSQIEEADGAALVAGAEAVIHAIG